MGTQTIVEDKFKITNDFAKEMYGNASKAIDYLIDPLNPKITPLPISATFTKPGDPDIPPLSPNSAPPDFGTLPDTPDSPSVITPPDVPVINTPTIPVIKDINIPDFTSIINDRDFTSTVPTFNLQPLSVPPITALNNSWGSSLNDAVRNKLLSNIQDGGTGLSPAIESAIFARETERGSQTLQDAIDKTTSQWAKMGFTLPDGLLSAEIATLNKEYMNKRLDVSRDISIEQAKLEQENLKYSLQYATMLELKMFDLADSYAQRAFLASKATIETLVQVYNSNLDTFKVKVQAYQAEAAAYESFIKSKLMEVEKWKAEIEGQKLIADVNEQDLKLYNAQWEGEIVKVKLYESQHQANIALIQYNKGIIDRYAAQIQAYAAKSNALVGQYNSDVVVYEADIRKWIARSDRDIRAAESSLRADIANVEKYLKDEEMREKADEWNFNFAYAKLKDTAELAARVASGALAGASASAALSFSESSNITP